MRLSEPETIIQLVLSCIIMSCCLVGSYTVFMMAKSESTLVEQIRSLSIMDDAQREISLEVSKRSVVLADANRKLTEELASFRERQDILRKIAEKLGVDVPKDHTDSLESNK